MKVTIRQYLKKVKRAFCRLQSVFLKAMKSFGPSYAPLVQIQLLYERLSLDAHNSLLNHIELLLWLGYQVQVEPTTQHIPSEYIGLASYWNGAKLEWQVYLQLQVVYFEKKQLSFHWIPSSSLLVEGSGLHNV